MPDRMAARRRMMSERMAMMDRAEASMRSLYAALSPAQRTAFDQLKSGPKVMISAAVPERRSMGLDLPTMGIPISV